MHLVDLLLAVQRVTVNTNLGVQAVQITGRRDHQRVDLDQCQIALFEQLGQANEDPGELSDLLAFETQLERQLAALVWLRADQRIDFRFQDLLRGFLGNLLDLDTAFGGGHEHDTTGTTVDYCAQVQLLVDVGEGFNQDFADRLAVLVCLVGYQLLAQPLLGKLTDLVFALDQLDTASLTTATCVNLSFDHPCVTADFTGCVDCFLWGITGNAFGYWQAIISEKLLALIFMQIHS